MACAATKPQDHVGLAHGGVDENVLGDSPILEPGMPTIDSRAGR